MRTCPGYSASHLNTQRLSFGGSAYRSRWQMFEVTICRGRSTGLPSRRPCRVLREYAIFRLLLWIAWTLKQPVVDRGALTWICRLINQVRGLAVVSVEQGRGDARVGSLEIATATIAM